MSKMSSLTKLVIVSLGFIALMFLMLFYGYSILSGRNQSLADTVAQQNREREVLDREQKSFEEGKKDLAQLQSSAYPPDSLFSSDTKVVKEIQQIEQLAVKYDLELDIAVSGTAATAAKAPNSAGEIYLIPYTLTLTGSFEDILMYMQSLEKMPFVTHVNSVALSVGAENVARATLASEFYIKK